MDYKYSVDHHFHGLVGFYNLTTKEKFNIYEINFGNDNDKNKFQIKFDVKKTKIDDSTSEIFKNAIKSFILNNINHLALYPPTKNLAKGFDIKTFDNKVLIVDMICVNKKEYVKQNIYDDDEKKIIYENKMKYYKSRNEYKFEKYKSKYLSLFNQRGGWVCGICQDNDNMPAHNICRSCGAPIGTVPGPAVNLVQNYTNIVTQNLNTLNAIIPAAILGQIIANFNADVVNVANLMQIIVNNIALINRIQQNFISGWVQIYDEPDIRFLEYFLIYIYIVNFIESLVPMEVNNIIARTGLPLVGTLEARKRLIIRNLCNHCYDQYRLFNNNFMNIAVTITNLITNNNPNVNFFRDYLNIQLDAAGSVDIAAIAGNNIYGMFLQALENPMNDVLDSINNNTLFNNVVHPVYYNGYINEYNIVMGFNVPLHLGVFNLALFQNNTWRNNLLLDHIFDLPTAHNHISWAMIHLFMTLATKFNTTIWDYNILQYFHSYLHILDKYNFNSLPGANNTPREIRTFSSIRRVITNYRNRNCIGDDATLVDQVFNAMPIPAPINITVAVAIAAARGVNAIPGGIGAVNHDTALDECTAAITTRQRIENALNINCSAFLYRNPAGNIYRILCPFGGTPTWFVTEDMGLLKFRQNPNFYQLRYIDIYDQYGIPHNTLVGQIRVDNGTGQRHNLVAGIIPRDVILRGVNSVSIGGTEPNLITVHPYIEMLPTTSRPAAVAAKIATIPPAVIAANRSPCKPLPA